MTVSQKAMDSLRAEADAIVREWQKTKKTIRSERSLTKNEKAHLSLFRSFGIHKGAARRLAEIRKEEISKDLGWKGGLVSFILIFLLVWLIAGQSWRSEFLNWFNIFLHGLGNWSFLIKSSGDL